MQTKIKCLALFVAIVLAFTFSVSSSAQTSRFGISVNSLTTNFNYGKSENEFKPYKKNYRGLQAGFYYQAGIMPMFSIVPELYFATKGGTLKQNNSLTAGKSRLRINSIEMPLLARLHCNNLYLNAGPYVGYNVGGQLKIEGTNASEEASTKLSFGSSSEDFRRWDLGFQAGVGYNFKLKQSILTLDVRYGYGLLNISQDVERYNRMLNISVQVSRPGKNALKQKRG